MRRLAIVILIVVVQISGAAVAAAQRSQRTPPRDRPAPRVGTGQIAGRVTSADGGAPLRQVEIALSSSGSGAPRLAHTDAAGQYRFADLPAGRYSLRASKPGFVPLRYGVADPLEPGNPIELSDGERVVDANFSLPRAAVISGQVTDEFGQPVLDAEVRALRYQIQQGQRRLTTASRVRLTDDLGAFRIFGLLPGTYYLSAVPRWRDPAVEDDQQSSYAPTYYPGTIDLAQARPLTVSLGGEVSGVNVALLALRTSRIRGTATDSAGAPAAGAQITAVRREAGNVFITLGEARARADGTFELTNLPPGPYSVQGFVRSVANARSEFGATILQLGEADLDGLILRTAPGGTLQGRVVLRSEAGQVPTSLRPSLIAITGRPAADDVRLPAGTASAARVRSDWTFELRDLSGPRRLRVSGEPSPWALESITLAGQDVTDVPIELKPGSVTTGAEVVLTTRTTDIEGTVDLAPSGSTQITILVYPADRSQRDPQSRRFQIRRADREGRFRIRGLPPGEYLAVAVPFIWQGEWTDADFLDRLSSSASRVRLAAAGRAAVRLKLTAASQ